MVRSYVESELKALGIRHRTSSAPQHSQYCRPRSHLLTDVVMPGSMFGTELARGSRCGQLKVL